LIDDPRWGALGSTLLSAAALVIAISDPAAGKTITRRHTLLVGACVLLSPLVLIVNSTSIVVGLTYLLPVALLVTATLPITIRRVLQHRRVTHETVLGALCTYVLLGLLFAFLFLAVDDFRGDPFFAQESAHVQSEYLYFSFVTLTTLGFGDLSPAVGLPQALTVLEALLGQVFLVTLVARLVTLWGAERRPRGGVARGSEREHRLWASRVAAILRDSGRAGLRKSGRRTRVALVGAALTYVLLLAAPVAEAARFGIADDAGKYEEGGSSFFREVRALGMTENRISVHWQPDRPRTIVDKAFLDRALPAARAQGIRVVFHVFALNPTALTASPGATEEFAAFLELLARTYPQVREYVVGNEPNQPRFWQPQFIPTGRGAAAAAYADLLARSYDALKGVDPGIRVIGLGLSGRGNDLPFARSNASSSPVRFLRDLGAAYRASGRSAPLMDELGVHPYPRSDRDSVLAGDRWPRAGLVNLARIKQAFWDAFTGTGQPTVEQGLRLRIDEIGWQAVVPASARPAYFGRETSAATSEPAQAANYAKLIEIAACDPSISALYLLHLKDDPDLERFQSGLLRADGSVRPARAAVRRAIARTRRGCTGKQVTWRHANSVVGARASFGGRREQPRARRDWGFNVTAAEEATYTGAIFRLPAAKATIRLLTSRNSPRLIATTEGLIRAGWKPRLRLPARRLHPGRYVYAVRLRATMNPSRTSFRVSRPFAVG